MVVNLEELSLEDVIKWFKNNPFYHKDHVPFNMAIKALEALREEKSENREIDVLDKVRAEIEQLLTYDDITGKSYFAREFKSDVLDVIDKYKAERS